ncbi:MAG: hypothetical protein M3Z05_19605 [Gemmatimonadota bacterium]|nr:hypothetical protein [Gemmatimonadota bacterium]
MTQITQYLALPWSWDIKYDQNEECWVATIAELPDFFAAGESAGEAAFNARDALISHLSGYVVTGTPIPTPKARSATTRTGMFEETAQLVA